jgi:hypothetical protein
MPVTSGAYYDFHSDSPESIRAKRKMIDTMLEQAADYKPLGHWSAALAQAMQGLVGGMGVYNLSQEEKDAKEAGKTSVKALFGGGTPAASESDVMAPAAPELTPPAPRAPIQPAPRVQAPTPADTSPALAGSSAPVGHDFVGPIVNGDRPYGRYGVMGKLIPSYTKEVLGEEMAPADFLTNPQAQEAVAKALGLGAVPQSMASPGASPPITSAPPGGAPVPAPPIPATSGLPTGAPAAPVLPGAAMPPVPPLPGGRPTAAAVWAERAGRDPAPPAIEPFMQSAGKENPNFVTILMSDAASPKSKELAYEALLKRAGELRTAATPLTQPEITERANKEATAQNAIYEAEKTRREVNKSRTGSEAAEAAHALLNQARQFPVDFGKQAFERGTGTYIGQQTPIWENFLGGVFGQVGQGVSEVRSMIEGGARPGQIQDALKGVQANMTALLGPMMRGPGSQSNYEVQQIESAIGALAKSTSVEDFNARLDRLETSVEALITRHGDPVKIMHTMAGPRSPNAPETAEAASERMNKEDAEKRAGTIAGVRALLPEMLGGYPKAAAPIEAPGPDYINRTRKGDMDERKAALRRAMLGAR